MEAAQKAGQGSGKQFEDRSLLVLYGTETGHSQEIAEEIGDAAERLRFRTTVEQMNDVALKELAQYSLAVFVLSTTGQGDMPANATAFWKSLLRKKLPPTCLGQVQFTIFGLGDSSYPKFNWAARKLEKRLLQLGGVEFYQAGEGDERHDNGIDSVYIPWFLALKSKVLAEFPLPNGMLPIPDEELLPPKYPIGLVDMDHRNLNTDTSDQASRETLSAALSHVEHPKSNAQQLDDQDLRRNNVDGFAQYAREGGHTTAILTNEGLINPDKDNIIQDHPRKYNIEPNTSGETTSPPHDVLPIADSWDCQVLKIKRVTPESHWQDVRLLEISIVKSEWNQENPPCLFPGDCVMIYPKNFPADVQTLIDMMDWQSVADNKVVWKSQNGKPCRPRNLIPLANATFREILLHNLDINAIPTRAFLKQLRRHTKSELERERLLELTQESNTHEFYDYTSRPRRTILEVLQDFPEVKIPMVYALEIFPVIRPRAFSIANSSSNHRDPKSDYRIVEILVALVEYKTIIRKPRQGLCSRYIKSLEPGFPLTVTLLKNNSPPHGHRDCTRPLVAIATGTGIAPIRSLIQERATWTSKNDTLLFFGCRSQNADYHFRDEWPLRKEVHVVTAFSRDPVDPAEEASLDPYTEQTKRLFSTAVALENKPAPISPQNTPWIRSFDYDRGKMYVQHQIRRHAHTLCDMLRLGFNAGQEPIIMICGNAGRMPTSVRHALEDALVIGGVAEDNENAKRILQPIVWMETW